MLCDEFGLLVIPVILSHLLLRKRQKKSLLLHIEGFIQLMCFQLSVC